MKKLGGQRDHKMFTQPLNPNPLNPTNQKPGPDDNARKQGSELRVQGSRVQLMVALTLGIEISRCR